MNCQLAGKAALLAALLYFVASTMLLVVKIIFTLLCLVCLHHLQRLIFTRRSSPFHSSSGSQSHAMASQPKAHKPIELKITIDKRSNNVLYAESNKDFVDLLLSFLTLPMGAIMRLADKRSGIGSMDELYKSVEALDAEECLWMKASKTMLLNPRSAYGYMYNNLVVKIDGTDYSKLYTCSSTPCKRDTFGTSFGFFSLVKNSICACRQAMENEIYMKNAGGNVGSSSSVFIKNAERYIISDDLKVLPLSIDDTLSWVKAKHVRDSTEVKKVEKVNIGVEEVLHLLHRSMVSNTPLTDVFVPHKNNTSPNSSRMPYQHQTEQNGSSTNQIMDVKLWFSKSTNAVLCIEAEEGFVNFLFTFLTFPLGAIIKMLKGKSSLGSIDKLYESAEKLSELQKISAECMEMLLSPKLERMFGCSYQLLQIQEETMPSSVPYYCSCWTFLQSKACEHFKPALYIMNPKRPSTATGGAFVKGCKWLVTDNLEIKPLSVVSDISKLGNIPFEDMESMPVIVGEEEALNLLQASLISKAVLNHAFSSQVINRMILQH